MRRHLRPMSCLLPSHGCSSKCTHAHSWAKSENMFSSSGTGNSEQFLFPVFWATMAAVLHSYASVPPDALMHTCSMQSMLLTSKLEFVFWVPIKSGRVKNSRILLKYKRRKENCLDSFVCSLPEMYTCRSYGKAGKGDFGTLNAKQ